MLIKYSPTEKRNKQGGNGKVIKTTGTSGKLGPSESVVAGRVQRKVLRVCPAKRPPAAPLSRAPVGSRHRQALRLPPDGHDDAAMDPCDNSNDSGLGLEHSSQDLSVSPTLSSSSVSLDNIMDDTRDSEDSQPRLKRSRLSVKAERMEEDEEEEDEDLGEESGDNFRFSGPLRELKGGMAPSVPRIPLSGAVCASTRDGRVTLSISTQPEQQHRARYQTEGSRGAVKDRSGHGFPVVKLTGHNKPAILQVFIGSDVERVAPHMFYQACRVCGKNSTPCSEQKMEGTVVIELQFEPAKNMVITCDCVGILKERNVDVEHRFPDESVPRSKKKSTRCRMVFRTSIERPDGSWETLQVVSQSIACTQLPGVPEISKRSLESSPCNGGAELFLLGKNFLKDSRVVFQQPLPSSTGKSSFVWEEEVIPDKEFLQPTHLVCVVPPFHRQDLSEPVSVRLFVRSSGKCSEPQTFRYLPSHNNRSPVRGATTTKLGQQPAAKQKPVAALPLPTVAERIITSKTSATLNERMVMPLILPSLLAGNGQPPKTAALPSTTALMMLTPAPLQEAAKVKSPQAPNVKEVQININQQLLMELLLRQKLVETPAAVPNASMCPGEANLLRQFVSENTGCPLPAQSGSSVEKFLSEIGNGAPENKVKTPNNNESFVSSTSLDFSETKRLVLNAALQSQAVPIINNDNPTSTQLEALLCKNIGEKQQRISSEPLLMHPVMPNNSLEIPMKQEENNFRIRLPEISTTSDHQNVMIPTVLNQVILGPTSNHPDSTVGSQDGNNSSSVLMDNQVHQPVMDLINPSTLIPTTIMQDVISPTSNTFNTNVSSAQLINQNVQGVISQPIIHETMVVEPLIGTENHMTTTAAMSLLNQALVSSDSNHFQPADTTMNNPVDSSMLVTTLPHEDATAMLPALHQSELVSEAHLLNSQLGQLLTTDILTESSQELASGNGPLVRDVLLGSVTPSPMLSSTAGLRLQDIESKKAPEVILPHDLQLMSEKDLLSYINPGCFDQVIP